MALAHAPTPDAALSEIQQSLVRACGIYDILFPTVICQPVTSLVPPFAYAQSSAAVDKAFFDHATSEPQVQLAPTASAAGVASPLESTGITVRFCAKTKFDHASTTWVPITKDEAMVREDAFHGMILAFGTNKQKAVQFAQTLDDGCLRVPLGNSEMALGLHVCAVQAEAVHLGRGVSFFGIDGRAGEPIHSPGSWMWRESAAIRPVDGALLGTFDLLPCSRESLLPENSALVQASRDHWRKCATLFTSLDEKNQIKVRGLPSCTSFCSNASDVETIAAPVDAAPDDAYAMAALHVNLPSRRTTLGAAYAYLVDSNCPDSIKSTMIAAIGELGIRASLSEMFELTAHSIKAASGVSPATVRENEKLKRTVEMAVDVLVNMPNKCIRRAPPTTISSNEIVRRLLGTLGLKRGEVLQFKHEDSGVKMNKVLLLLVAGLRRQACDTMIPDIAHETLANVVKTMDADDWKESVERALATALGVVVCANAMQDMRIFLISSTVGENAVRIERVTCVPTLSPSSFDELLQARNPIVILVQHIACGKVRLTTTTTAV